MVFMGRRAVYRRDRDLSTRRIPAANRSLKELTTIAGILSSKAMSIFDEKSATESPRLRGRRRTRVTPDGTGFSCLDDKFVNCGFLISFWSSFPRIEGNNMPDREDRFPHLDPSLESTDLFLLKHIWKISPEQDRQLLMKLFSDDCKWNESDPATRQLASLRQTWLRLTELERSAWREFVNAKEPAAE